MNSYNYLKKSIEAFDAVALKHSAMGAQDTEPDGIFQSCIWRAFQAEEYNIPTTASGWQLFTGMDNVEDAAKELTEATQFVIKCLHATYLVDLSRTRALIKETCWRI